MKSKVVLTVLSLGVMALAFQNCSQTHFTSGEGTVYFKAEALPTGSVLPSNQGGNDGSTMSGPTTSPTPGSTTGTTPSPTPGSTPGSMPGSTDTTPGSITDGAPTPTPAPMPSVTPGDGTLPPVAGSNQDRSGGNCKDKGNEADDDSKDNDSKDVHGKDPVQDLVECELMSPSMKIKLNQTFEGEHSNDSSTRVCMTENACLKILNTYAADHNCSMALGAATSTGNPTQCTEVFPGSKGTCHNAKVLSDDAISAILANMAK
ncbi:MAG: hypothetical protein ACXWRE_07220 [Pseudobdellovibrionaceae bacterium]